MVNINQLRHYQGYPKNTERFLKLLLLQVTVIYACSRFYALFFMESICCKSFASKKLVGPDLPSLCKVGPTPECAVADLRQTARTDCCFHWKFCSSAAVQLLLLVSLLLGQSSLAFGPPTPRWDSLGCAGVDLTRWILGVWNPQPASLQWYSSRLWGGNVWVERKS